MKQKLIRSYKQNRNLRKKRSNRKKHSNKKGGAHTLDIHVKGSPMWMVDNANLLAKQWAVANEKPLSLLFLCAGNTCRSATAEVFATQILKDAAVIRSAGLRMRDQGGAPINFHARNQFAQQHCEGDINCYNHKSQQAAALMMDEADYIFIMDRGLIDTFKENFQRFENKTSLLCEEEDVPDPYYTSEELLTVPHSHRHGHYYTMIEKVQTCLIQRLYEIFNTEIIQNF
jgi:protein-tyrosine-phosphatase